MSDPNHTSRTSKIDIRIPHDLLTRLDDIAARTNGNRTSALVLALRQGLPAVESKLGIVAAPEPPPIPDVPEWVDRWRDRFGTVTNAEIARAERLNRMTVAKWRERVERGGKSGSSP